MAKKPEKGALYGNLCFIFAFIMGIVYDMIENGSLIKFISPMKYFLAKDLIAGHLDLFFLVLCIVLTIILMFVAFRKFQKNELI